MGLCGAAGDERGGPEEVIQEETGRKPGAGVVDQGPEAPRASTSLAADEAERSSLVGDEQGGLVEVNQEVTGKPPGTGEVDQGAKAPRASIQLMAKVTSVARFRWVRLRQLV